MDSVPGNDLRTLSPVEAAWVAGLLEGEGSFLLERQALKSDPDHRRLRVDCSMTDLDVMRKLHKIVGGGLNPPRRQGAMAHYKISQRWALTRRADVLDLLIQIRPHMGERRGNRIDEMLTYAQDHPLLDGNQVRWHGNDKMADDVPGIRGGPQS